MIFIIIKIMALTLLIFPMIDSTLEPCFDNETIDYLHSINNQETYNESEIRVFMFKREQLMNCSINIHNHTGGRE